MLLVHFRYICDGHEHCLNREDECVEGCLYSFLCGNGNCVTSTFRCDGEDNCGDMSDECDAGCLRTFECANGKCIAIDKFCNGVDDCGDGTDEQIPLPTISKQNSISPLVQGNKVWNRVNEKYYHMSILS